MDNPTYIREEKPTTSSPTGSYEMRRINRRSKEFQRLTPQNQFTVVISYIPFLLYQD